MTVAAHAISAPPRVHADLGAVYRLADHLDATLALGEDLLKRTLDVAPLAAGADHAAITERQHAIAAFARAVRAMELGLVSRLLQARTRAAEVRDIDARFKPVLGLFVGGLAPLADAAQGRDGGLGDVSATALMSGTDVVQFLASRMVIGTDVRSLATVAALRVSEDYLLAERIHLGTLLDMVAQALDTLDLAFDLYAEPRKDA